MMKNIKMISRIVPALALLAATAVTTTLRADTLDRVATRVVASSADAGPTVRVMNNYGHEVRVYVVDRNNRRHLLGRLDGSEFKNLQIPAGLARGDGTVQLRVYPVLPRPGLALGLGVFGVSAHAGENRILGKQLGEPVGIKTRVLSVRSDQVIELYLEPDLSRSKVGIVSS